MHSKEIMKRVQKTWRAMPAEEKEYYKQQSRENRVEYDQEKKEFDELKMATADKQLHVIEGVRHRREIKAAEKEKQE